MGLSQGDIVKRRSITGYHPKSFVCSWKNYPVAGWTSIPEAHTWAPFYLHGLTLISAWLSNYIHYKVWGEITYPFLNFNGAIVEVQEQVSNFIHTLQACNYLSMLGLKLNHINKIRPGRRQCLALYQ